MKIKKRGETNKNLIKVDAPQITRTHRQFKRYIVVYMYLAIYSVYMLLYEKKKSKIKQVYSFYE